MTVGRARGVLLLSAFWAAALVASSAWALDPGTPLGGYTRPSWSVREGLPQANVRALTQTPDGYLWVGTDAGIARFDGVRFRVPDDHASPWPWRRHSVRMLFPDDAGGLWIGSNNREGLLRLRPGQVESFAGRTLLESNPIISALKDRGGTIWFGGWRGVTQFVGNTFRRPAWLRAINDPVFALAQATDGAIWVGRLHGLSRIVGETITNFGPEQGLPNSAARAIAFDREGRLWIGTEAGLFLQGPDARFSRWGPDRGLPDPRVKALLVDRAGVLWVGTEGGLARLVGQRLESLRVVDGLLDPFVTALFEDAEGNLWVGTVAGLQRLGDSRIRMWTIPPGDGVGLVRAVIQARDGSFWIGTSSGVLFHVRNGTWRSVPEVQGVCPRDIWALHEDAAGRLWVAGLGTDGANLCMRQGDRVTSFGAAQGLPDRHQLRAIAEVDGKLMVAGQDLFVWRDERFQKIPLPGKRPTASIHEIRPDKQGRLWLATAPVLTIEPSGEVKTHPLEDDVTRTILPDGRRYWMGSARGLSLYQDGRLHRFGEEVGLFDDMVASIVDGGSEQLWMCTRRGLVRVSKVDLLAVAAGQRTQAPWSRLGAGDGYAGDQCDPGEGDAGGGRAADGQVFFAATRGVAFLDPAPPAQSPSPSVLIERVVADGRVLSAASGRVPPGRGDLEIEYTATALRDPERIFFRYRLAPFDQRWVEAGSRRVAYYTNVPPGRYRFEVEARSDEGAFAPRLTATSLELAPHFHQTWFFRALMLLGLAALAVAAHRVRVRQVEARHAAVLRERNRIAREIHDTLAQGFTGISLHLESARSRVQAPPEAVHSLKQARELVDLSLEEARRAVWDLRAESVERSGVLPALEDLVKRLEPRTPVRFSATGRPRDIPSRHASALLRVGQEAITNALRHAQPSRIDVRLVYEPRAAELRITDDGAGIGADAGDERGGHFGLAGMRERVEELGGQLSIDSALGQGTTIIARVPLPAEDRPWGDPPSRSVV